jgi:insulysin
MRGLSAFDVKQPYFHASYYSQIALQPPRFQYDNTALREAIREVNLSDLIEYVNTLWKSGRGEALIQGNFDQKEAMELVKNIGDVLPFRPIVQEEYPSRLEALPLPAYGPKKLPTKLIVAEPNPDNENSVATVMLQSLGTSEKDHVLIELISSIVQEPFYNELRTKKQLGYIVSSGIRAVGNSRTLSFIVQSSVAPADKLSIEIVKFLNTVEDRFLNKLLKADLAVYVKSLIDRKTEPDKELATEVTRNWAEIASGRFQFDRIQREAAALLDVQKEDLLDFWRRIYTGDNCRVLVTQVVPRQGPASSPVPAKSTGYNDKDPLPEGLVLGIDDLDQFRADRQIST